VKRLFFLVLLFALGSLAIPAGGSVADQPLSSVVLSSLGPGYTVVNDGPLTLGALAPVFPAAAIIRDALASDGASTYQRTWQDASHTDKIQILLVRFNSETGAHSFWSSLRGLLASARTMSTQSVPGMSHTFRTTYFAKSSSQVGVGQVIVVDSGSAVATLSFFSSGTPAISSFDARNMAQLQVAAITPVSILVVRPHTANRPDHMWDWIGLGIAVALVLVLASLVVVRSRRRGRGSSQEMVDVSTVEPARPMDFVVVAGIVAASFFRRRS
jgi:hypothetical protein